MRDEYKIKIAAYERSAGNEQETIWRFDDLVNSAQLPSEYEYLAYQYARNIEGYLEQGVEVERILPFYYGYILNQFRIGAHHEAIDVWNEVKPYVVKSDPEMLIPFLDVVADAYRSANDHENALSFMEEAIDIARRHGVVDLLHKLYTNLGNVYASKKEYSESFDCFNKALELGPDDFEHQSDTLVNMAAAAAEIGEYQLVLEIAHDLFSEGSINNDPDKVLALTTATLAAFIDSGADRDRIDAVAAMNMESFCAVVQDSYDPIVKGNLCHNRYCSIGNIADYYYDADENIYGLEFIERGKIVYDSEMIELQIINDLGFPLWLDHKLYSPLLERAAYMHLHETNEHILIYILVFVDGESGLYTLRFGKNEKAVFDKLARNSMEHYQRATNSENDSLWSAWNDNLRSWLKFIDEILMSDVKEILLDENISKIYISPHGMFSNLPFHAIDWFVNNSISVAYMPSLTMLATIQQDYNFEGNICLVKNNDKSLTYSPKELDYIEQLALNRGCRIGLINAEEIENIGHDFWGNGIIHFSGHGRFDLRHIGRSCLLVGQTKIDLYDILNLPAPSHQNLINISACSGAESMNWNASSALSIAGAFLSHGYAPVIACSWPVSDFGAYLFNKEFYKNIISHIANPYAAYRNALNKLRDSSDKFSMAVNWAQFKYYGLIPN